MDHYLDEYNGHEHGDLGYHYHVTIDADGAGVFPYLSGPKYRGCLTASTASAAARKLHSHLSVEGIEELYRDVCEVMCYVLMSCVVCDHFVDDKLCTYIPYYVHTVS